MNATTHQFAVRDAEAGTVIDTFLTLAEAEEALARYESEDVVNGNYTEGFYEMAELDSDGDWARCLA